jgi:hypothetical protein
MFLFFPFFAKTFSFSGTIEILNHEHPKSFIKWNLLNLFQIQNVFVLNSLRTWLLFTETFLCFTMFGKKKL